MSLESTIDDLPDEMLEYILKHLDWYDRRSLTMVSKRLARLAFGTGSDTALIVYNHNVEEMYSVLASSQRPYRHFILCLSGSDNLATNLKIVEQFQQSINSLMLRSDRAVDLEWVATVLQLCPNLNYLDVKKLTLSKSDGRALEPMNKLRTLHAFGNFLKAIPNCSEVFANVTSLHVNVILPKELIRKLSRQLIELNLTYNKYDDDQVVLPEEDFPCLETLTCKWADRLANRLTVDHFRKLLERSPKLKVLAIEPVSFGQINLLKLLIPHHETLRHLETPLENDFDENQGQNEKTRLKNLTSLCLWDIEFITMKYVLSSFVFENVRRLQLVRGNLANLGWMDLLCGAFPKLEELELQDEQDYKIQFPLLAELTSRELPSLRRLIVDLRFRKMKLAKFMQFCGVLKVSELHVELDHFNDGGSKCPKLAPTIRSLSIRAYSIHQNVYVPMLGSMPELRRLELELNSRCSNEIVQMIREKFPRCDVVRKHYKCDRFGISF